MTTSSFLVLGISAPKTIAREPLIACGTDLLGKADMPKQEPSSGRAAFGRYPFVFL